MSRQIKFTVGNSFDGYKTIEVIIRGGKVTYQILRSGLLNVDKKFSSAQMSEAWLAELDALNIFDWEKNYSSDVLDGTQWELTFKDGKKIYRAQGSNAYPENFERFLDWLDALAPELEFVNRRRLEKVTLNYFEECLTLDRHERTLTLNKKISRHTYDAGEDIKKIFDVAQSFFDGLEVEDADINFSSRASFEVVLHDGSIKTFETPYTENFLPGLNDFIDVLKSCASDLTAEIFSPSPAEVVPPQGKLILCKVQFKGSYKHYTYQSDDETLAVGDVVDVPVGKNNDVNQARVVEIGYFDEYEAPFPIDRIKKIIGKHIADDFDDY